MKKTDQQVKITSRGKSEKKKKRRRAERYSK